MTDDPNVTIVDCLRLAAKIRRWVAEAGGNLPEITGLRDLNGKFFARLYRFLCQPHVASPSVQIDDDRADVVQQVIDAIGHDFLSMDLSHLNVRQIVNGNPPHVYELLKIFSAICKCLQHQSESLRSSTNMSLGSSPMAQKLRELGQNHQITPSVSYAQQLKKFYEQFGQKSVLYSPSLKSHRTTTLIKRPAYGLDHRNRHAEYLKRLGTRMSSPRINKLRVEGMVLQAKAMQLKQENQKLSDAGQLAQLITAGGDVSGTIDRRLEELQSRAQRSQAHNARVTRQHMTHLEDQSRQDVEMFRVSHQVQIQSLQMKAKAKFLRDVQLQHNREVAEAERQQVEQLREKNQRLALELAKQQKLREDHLQMAEQFCS